MKKKFQLRNFRPFISRWVTLALVSTLLTVPTSAIINQTASAAITDTCSSTLAAQNGIKVTPSHGQAFYIDSGITPKLDAGYVGYIVSNTTALAKKGYWLKISDFAGGVVSLANIDDQYMQLDDLGIAGSGSESSTAYIMLKASAATTQAQSHIIRIFDKRPDLTGASELYSCKYSFSAVKETIKAASNKVSDGGTTNKDYDTNSTAIDVSNTSPQLGENIVITVEGQPGQVGQGGVPDYDSIWLTPAAVSSWPTRALKLVDVSVTFEGGNDWGTTTDQVTYNDRLLITGANGLANVDQKQYVARYTFRVIGNPGAGVKAVPVAQIASGTQMKHTDTSGAGATATINFTTVAINYSLAKRATSTSNLETATVGGNTYLKIPYELRMTSTSATTTYIDELVDIPVSVGIFDTGTARITDATRTNVVLPDPTYITAEASLNPRPIHFVGPFGISSSSPVILTYKLMVPAVTTTYTNQAYGMVGDLKIGASASTIPQVVVTTTSGSTSVTAETSTVTSAVDAITTNATNVDTKTATLNATIDPNGNGGTAIFQYGTSSSLSSFTEVTATTPSSGTLTGSLPLSADYTIPGTLTPNTTYYFRIRVGTVYGDILSFTTNGVASAPTAVTLAADPVGTSTATLNGTINPNFSNVVLISFFYKSSATALTAADLDSGTEVKVYESDGTTLSTAGGGTSQAFLKSLTGLANGTTYYFKIRGCTALSGSNCSGTSYEGGVQNFTTGRSNQTITFAAITDKTYGDGTFSISPTASSNLTVSVSSLTPTVCTISGGVVTILSVGTCTLRATQPGNSSFNPAPTVDQSFYVNPKTLTITAEDKSKIYGQDTPSWTNTLTGFAGSDSATITNIVRTFAGKSVAYPESSTAPTAVGTYSIILANASLSFSTGSASNYVIAYVEGTYTINDAVAQTITFNSLSSVIYGVGGQTMTATASSGLTVTYTVSGPCTVSGAVVTVTGVGTCVITAAQSGGTSGGTTYGPATSVVQNLVITATPLVIAATTSSSSITYGSASPTFGKTLTGLKYSDSVTAAVLTFTSSSPSYNSTSVPTAVGVYTLTPSSPTFSPSGAASNYTISYETTTYTINKADQTITFTQPTSPLTYGVSPVNLGATASSGLTVTYTVSGPCTISGSTVTFTGIGSCVITAAQGGNSNYNAALSVSRTIVIDPKSLTITASSHTVANGATAPTITPTYSGFAGSETQTVLSGTLTCSITGYNSSVAADYASNCSGFGSTNGNYTITYVAGVVTVASGTVASQTITFDALSGVTYGVSPQSETATASSGLGVTFSVSGPCTLSGSTVTVTGVGTCSITASQSGGTIGGTTYSAAPSVTRDLVISPASLTVTAVISSASIQYGGTAATKSHTVSGLQYSDSITATTLTFTSSSPSYNNVNVPAAAGTYTLTPSNPVFGTGSSSNYTISYVTTTYTITQKSLTITASSHAVTTGDPIPTITASYNAFAGSESVADLSGTQTCSTTYTTSSAAGSYPTSCSGYSSSNYSITYVNGAVTATASTPVTYTFTYTLNGGTGTTPTESDKASGVSVTLADSTGFSKSGNTFAGWSCNSGSTQAALSSYVMPSAAVTCVAQWTVDAATTYSITYTAGGGSGTVPTQSPLASGATFTTGSGSGLSRSGYTFAGWSCNSGSTVGVGVSVTMTAASMTCVAQWTVVASNSNNNSGGGSAAAPGKSGSTPAAAKKAAVVTLVTVATTPVKATAVVVTSAPTPGNSGSTPSSGSAGTTTPGNSGSTPSSGSAGTTTPGNSGSTPSSGSAGSTSGSTGSSGSSTTAPGNSGSTPPATGSTPNTGGTVPTGSANQTPISVANTKLSQTTVITNSGTTAITFKGVGVSAVTVKDDVVSVAARPGFSGKTTVAITLTNSEEISQITAQVVVLPLPVTNPVVKPVAEDRSRVNWLRSPNAIGYEVIKDGQVICSTTKVSCVVNTLIAPEAKVEIKAIGRDQTESLVKEAKYVEAAVAKVVPDIALVVNFDTAKFNLDAGDKALIRAFAADVIKFGYTRVDITGHTDARGGIDNNVLSNNRAKAARDYLLSLVPTLKVTVNGFADAISVATNKTAEGMAANRRAEFRVVG